MRHRLRAGTVASVIVLLALAAPSVANASSTPTGLPDLAWSSYSWQGGCDFALLDVSVINNGAAEAGRFVVASRVDKRHYGVAKWDQVLPPGEIAPVGPWPLVHLSHGAHLVEFFIDYGQDVQESNESDNLVAFAVIC